VEPITPKGLHSIAGTERIRSGYSGADGYTGRGLFVMFRGLKKRWLKCILGGDYFKGDDINFDN